MELSKEIGLILLLFYIFFVIILFIKSYYFGDEEPEILAYNKIMSDELKITEEQSSPVMNDESVTQVSQNKLDVDIDFKEKLFKFMDNQNKIIEELRKQNVESQKTIEELTEKITDVKSVMTENVPTVLGKFDFDKTIDNLSKEQSEQLYKENKEIYDIIKNIWKY